MFLKNVTKVIIAPFSRFNSMKIYFALFPGISRSSKQVNLLLSDSLNGTFFIMFLLDIVGELVMTGLWLPLGIYVLIFSKIS